MSRWIILMVMVALILTGCATTNAASEAASLPYAGELRGAVFDPPREISDFTLASTSGEDFTLSQHKGQILLLYFGYRACPDFCPTTFVELRRVYQELNEPADKLKIVFVTVDPERDKLPELTLYTHAFHEDFIGLRAEGQPLQAVMNEFGVVAKKQQVGDSALAYMVDHTASVFLIGPDGRLQAQYLYGTDYKDILHDVQIILESA